MLARQWATRKLPSGDAAPLAASRSGHWNACVRNLPLQGTAADAALSGANALDGGHERITARPRADATDAPLAAKHHERRNAVQAEARRERGFVVDVLVQPGHIAPAESIRRLQQLGLGDVAVGAVIAPEKQDAYGIVGLKERVVERGCVDALHA